MKEYLEMLKDVERRISMPNVINFLNAKDVDYSNWNDLQMIIYYIENNK
jgi:hypothetical protein